MNLVPVDHSRPCLLLHPKTDCSVLINVTSLALKTGQGHPQHYNYYRYYDRPPEKQNYHMQYRESEKLHKHSHRFDFPKLLFLIKIPSLSDHRGSQSQIPKGRLGAGLSTVSAWGRTPIRPHSAPIPTVSFSNNSPLL